jgi:dolichol-phosphate mannosyltransferase
MRYRELFGTLGFEAGIEIGPRGVSVVSSPSLHLSPHVLYTNVIEPILRWTFVEKGYALVHGATIAFGDKAYMITARTDTGKTTTLLKILSHQRRDSDRAGFISDDMTIVSADGMAFTYPKPMTISYHTLRAVNRAALTPRQRFILPFQSRIHSRSGRQFAFLLSKTRLPAATINMVVQMLIPPPKYAVNQLVPTVKMTREARFAGMFVIERGQDAQMNIETNEALDVLLENCEDAYGFPPYNDIKEFLYNNGKRDLRQAEQAIIRAALGDLPATLVRNSKMDWWCLIPNFVDQEMAKDCSCGQSSVPSLQTSTARA